MTFSGFDGPAGSATADDTVADGKPAFRFGFHSHLCDFTDELQPDDGAGAASPAMGHAGSDHQIRPVQPAGADAHQDFVRLGRGRGDVLNLDA